LGGFSNHRTSFSCVQFSQSAIAIRQLLILERNQEVFWSFHWCKFWKLELEILHPGLCLGWPVDYTLHRMWDKRQFSESSCTKVWVGYKWFFWPCLAAIQSFNKAQIAVNWIGRLMNNVLWFDSMGISVILRALFTCFLCGTMWCCLQSDWPKLSYLVLFQHITCKYVSKQWAKMC
jgi:hypothetical protein